MWRGRRRGIGWLVGWLMCVMCDSFSEESQWSLWPTRPAKTLQDPTRKHATAQQRIRKVFKENHNIRQEPRKFFTNTPCSKTDAQECTRPGSHRPSNLKPLQLSSNGPSTNESPIAVSSLSSSFGVPAMLPHSRLLARSSAPPCAVCHRAKGLVARVYSDGENKQGTLGKSEYVTQILFFVPALPSPASQSPPFPLPAPPSSPSRAMRKADCCRVC